MDIPVDRKYSESHEWYLIDGNEVTMGITQFAADELTDITYVELPEVGTTLKPGDACGEVESVKATSEIFCAFGGKVKAVNDELADRPELVNEDAFDEGWMLKIDVDGNTDDDSLMDAQSYKTFIKD